MFDRRIVPRPSSLHGQAPLPPPSLLPLSTFFDVFGDGETCIMRPNTLRMGTEGTAYDTEHGDRRTKGENVRVIDRSRIYPLRIGREEVERTTRPPAVATPIGAHCLSAFSLSSQRPSIDRTSGAKGSNPRLTVGMHYTRENVGGWTAEDPFSEFERPRGLV
ncbi:hypothetical protein GY45DRAFT_1329102 [Cubamyces sp. BRFM 1775]|nr:hypothetical protein GY45DRAFT_1329102 [Cubamyces sp. BRFM 1775]